jgi:hypothetical protein
MFFGHGDTIYCMPPPPEPVNIDVNCINQFLTQMWDKHINSVGTYKEKRVDIMSILQEPQYANVKQAIIDIVNKHEHLSQSQILRYALDTNRTTFCFGEIDGRWKLTRNSFLLQTLINQPGTAITSKEFEGLWANYKRQ